MLDLISNLILFAIIIIQGIRISRLESKIKGSK